MGENGPRGKLFEIMEYFFFNISNQPKFNFITIDRYVSKLMVFMLAHQRPTRVDSSKSSKEKLAVVV